VLTFRLAVVHSLPSAILLEEAIMPDRFWSFGERCVDLAPPTNPNAIISGDCRGTTSTRRHVVPSHGNGAIAECVFAPFTSPHLTEELACGTRSGRSVNDHHRTTERHTPQPTRVSLAELRGFLEIALGELGLDLRLRGRRTAERHKHD
jgi:hypothetical protein